MVQIEVLKNKCTSSVLEGTENLIRVSVLKIMACALSQRLCRVFATATESWIKPLI